MKNKILLLLLVLSIGVIHSQQSAMPRLSALPADINKEKISLSGTWLFNPSPQAHFWEHAPNSQWKPIEVPGEWVMQGFEVEKGKAAGYQRSFILPSTWKGKRIKLRCNGIYSDATLFINGKKIGHHLGGFTAFEFDVTDFITFTGKNEMAVSVASESIADGTSNASNYAVHQLGGITRELFLFSLPEVNASTFHVSTSFDSTYTDAVLKTEIELTNDGCTPSEETTLFFELTDPAGKKIILDGATQIIRSIEAKETLQFTYNFKVSNPLKWDPEHPNLYKLTCKLMNGDKVTYSSVRRVGFRQIEVVGNQLFVNNMPIKLRGVCHHEVMPLRGRSVNNDMWRKDVEIFREGNVNYLRTSHYPPSEELLDACDELGMFVEVEAPFCWAHRAEVPEDKRQEILIDQHLAMVNLNRSHPSVLMWSMGNESNLYKEYFKEAANRVKQIDPTRPRIFSQWGPDADSGELELTNHHYPGPEGPEKYRNYKRPIVFDEFCHLNAYNRLELAADPGLRSMWGVLLDSMWNDMYYSQGVLGGAIWAGIDDTFFLSGERAIGYGTWGVIDGWRRHKPEFWGMKKAFSPVKIKLQQNQNKAGRIYLKIENRHLFTNLNETQIKWSVGDKCGILSPDLKPGCQGEYHIDLPEEVRHAGYIDLEVKGVRGFTVDTYHFQTLPKEFIPSTEKGRAKVKLTQTADEYNIQTVCGKFVIDKTNGLFTAIKDGKRIFLNSPALMLLPLNGEGEGKQMIGKNQEFKPFTPVCARWIAESVAVTKKQTAIVVQVTGKYDEAEGAFTYHFKNDGKIEISYDFMLTKDLSPRQIGVVFTVPDSFDKLEWKRKGYWSVYPENDLGALTGKAIAFDTSLPISGLAGPSKQPENEWSFDQTAAGSNLFRATKENIYQATLINHDNQCVQVISDGTQHFRAWKNKHNIQFLVADYNNAGNGAFLTSHSSKDYRPLKKGDTVKGEITLSVQVENDTVRK